MNLRVKSVTSFEKLSLSDQLTYFYHVFKQKYGTFSKENLIELVQEIETKSKNKLIKIVNSISKNILSHEDLIDAFELTELNQKYIAMLYSEFLIESKVCLYPLKLTIKLFLSVESLSFAEKQEDEDDELAEEHYERCKGFLEEIGVPEDKAKLYLDIYFYIFDPQIDEIDINRIMKAYEELNILLENKSLLQEWKSRAEIVTRKDFLKILIKTNVDNIDFLQLFTNIRVLEREAYKILKLQPCETRKLMRIFEQMDLTSTKVITKHEFLAFCHTWNLGPLMKREEAAMFEEIDLDQDSTISKWDLLATFAKTKNRKLKRLFHFLNTQIEKKGPKNLNNSQPCPWFERDRKARLSVDWEYRSKMIRTFTEGDLSESHKASTPRERYRKSLSSIYEVNKSNINKVYPSTPISKKSSKKQIPTVSLALENLEEEPRPQVTSPKPHTPITKIPLDTYVQDGYQVDTEGSTKYSANEEASESFTRATVTKETQTEEPYQKPAPLDEPVRLIIFQRSTSEPLKDSFYEDARKKSTDFMKSVSKLITKSARQVYYQTVLGDKAKKLMKEEFSPGQENYIAQSLNAKVQECKGAIDKLTGAIDENKLDQICSKDKWEEFKKKLEQIEKEKELFESNLKFINSYLSLGKKLLLDNQVTRS